MKKRLMLPAVGVAVLCLATGFTYSTHVLSIRRDHRPPTPESSIFKSSTESADRSNSMGSVARTDFGASSDSLGVIWADASASALTATGVVQVGSEASATADAAIVAPNATAAIPDAAPTADRSLGRSAPAPTSAPAHGPASAQSPRASAATAAPDRWFGFYLPNCPDSISPLTALESRTGARAHVVNFFIADSESFPLDRCRTAAAHGSTPMVTLEFWSLTSGGLSAITNGSRDAYLTTFAKKAKAYGGVVWVRPFHEMNGTWYPWANTGSNSPGQLVAAWRHVHGIFVAQGATNVKFVWCPNVEFNVKSYWPGDKYVDYAAIDGYNFGTPWRSFSSFFGPTYKAVAALTTKPMFIAETACAEGSGKAAWIADMFKAIGSKYPRIKGVCWFDTNKERDWRVESSSASLRAFKAIVSAGY